MSNEYWYRARNSRKSAVMLRNQMNEIYDYVDSTGCKFREAENIHSHWGNGYLNWAEDLKQHATELQGDVGLYSISIPLTCKVEGKIYNYQFSDWLDKARGIGSHWYKEECK